MHWNDQLWKCIDSAAEALSGLERSSKGIASMRIATEQNSYEAMCIATEWQRMAEKRKGKARL